MRKLTKLAAGVAVAALFTIGAVVPANAASNDFTPSPNKFREYMLNITSNVLKGAMPNAWKREQLANQYRYNYGWETLNAQFGFDSANKNYLGAPDSYDDYMIRRMEMDKKGGFGNQQMKAPVTKPSLWQKTAKGGGALLALTGFPIGTALGTGAVDLVGGFFGFDANDGVCSQPDGFAKSAQELITGRDCSMWAPTMEYLESLVGMDAKCVKANANNVYCLLPVFTKVRSDSAYTFTFVCAVTETLPLAEFPDIPPHTGGVWAFKFESGRIWKSGTGQWASNPAPGECGGGTAGGLTVGYHTYWRATGKNDPLHLENGRIVDFWPEATSVGKFVAPNRTLIDQVEEFQLECAVTLDNGTVVRNTGKQYGKATDSLEPPACPSIPAGRTASNVEIKEQQVGAPPGSGETVSNQPTTPEYQDWAQTYPECGTGACKLDLIQKPKASCFDLEYQCADWFEDPDKTTKYQCRYGVKDVELEECAVYAGLFKPGRVDTGSPYTDPETGVWSGGKNSLEESRNAMGLPVQNPAEIRACDGTSGAGTFDPIRFIMRPIQCALEWAFVPRPAVVEAELSGGEQAWDKKPPKVIADVVSGFSLTPSVSGCSRSVTIFTGGFASTITPMNACPGSWGETAANVSRVATTAAMVVLVVVIVRRQISGMIGYGAGQ